MVDPAPTPTPSPNAPGRKVTIASFVTYVLFTGLLAIVQALGANVNVLISALPGWANVFITPLAPVVIMLITGWVTKHAPQDLSLPVKQRRLR